MIQTFEILRGAWASSTAAHHSAHFSHGCAERADLKITFWDTVVGKLFLGG